MGLSRGIILELLKECLLELLAPRLLDIAKSILDGGLFVGRELVVFLEKGGVVKDEVHEKFPVAVGNLPEEREIVTAVELDHRADEHREVIRCGAKTRGLSRNLSLEKEEVLRLALDRLHRGHKI
jgi:hypothetical protein